MTKFSQTDIISNPSSIINYYLVNMNLYQSDIQTTTATDGNYHIRYNRPTANSNNFNVIYYNNLTSENENYIVTDVYFYNLIHDNILGVTDGSQEPGSVLNLIGELVFETTNFSGGTVESRNSKLFLCFLIQNANGGNGISPSKATDDLNGAGTGSIGKMFNNIISDGNGNIVYGSSEKGTTTISPSVDGTIPKQDRAIIYFDSGHNATVVVYLNPITVAVASEIQFLFSMNNHVSPVISNYPSKTEHILNAKTTGTGIVDISNNSLYNENSQIYIDCSPTGASKSSITTYNLPINSDLMSDIQHSSFAQLCTNFALFGIMLLAAYIGIPKLYNLAVCEKMDGDQIMYAKSFIILFLMVISLALFAGGNQSGNMKEMIAGFFIIFLTIITYILISNEELAANRSFGNFNMIDFFSFIGGVAGFIFEKCLASIFVLWIILLTILVILSYSAKKDNGEPVITNTQFRDIMLWVGLVAIPTIVGLLVQITS
jgi:hypothetical protein